MIAIETSDRRPSGQAAEVIRLKEVGVAHSEIAERSNIAVAIVYRPLIAAKIDGNDRKAVS